MYTNHNITSLVVAVCCEQHANHPYITLDKTNFAWHGQYFVKIKKDGSSHITTSLLSRTCVTTRDLLSDCHRVRVSDLAEIRITHRDKRSGRATRHPLCLIIFVEIHTTHGCCVFFWHQKRDRMASLRSPALKKWLQNWPDNFSSNQSARNVLAESER